MLLVLSAVLLAEGDEGALEALGRDGQHAPDRRRVLRVAKRRVTEQRVDGREPMVPGAHPVVPVALEVVQKRGHERRVRVADVEVARPLAGPAVHTCGRYP